MQAANNARGSRPVLLVQLKPRRDREPRGVRNHPTIIVNVRTTRRHRHRCRLPWARCASPSHWTLSKRELIETTSIDLDNPLAAHRQDRRLGSAAG